VDRFHNIGDCVLTLLDAEARGSFRGTGRFVAQGLEEPQHPVGARGRANHDRANQAVAQFFDQIVEYLVARRLDVFEQLLHQLVVVIGELFQHRKARLLLAGGIFALDRHDLAFGGFAIDEGALEREIDEALDDVVLPDRNLAQYERHARRGLQERERLAHALVGLIDLVDEDEAGNLAVFQLAHDQLQLRQLALVGLADDDRGIDRRECGAHVLSEFDRAGAIEKRIGVAEKFSRGDGELHAHAVGAGFGRGVAHGRAGFDGTGALYGAGAFEDRFEEGGLAGLKGADKRDAARAPV
jgi:hypothetical protein